MLYFKIGGIVSKKVSAGSWGDNIVEELSQFILISFPNLKGFNRRGLYRMKLFFETYDSYKFVSTLMTLLNKSENETRKFVSTVLTRISGSSHLHILSKTNTNEEKIFYIQYTIAEKLSVRELERQMNSALFERTAMANKNISFSNSKLPKDIFRDPYIFEFLDLPLQHSEKDLENALVENLKQFILEVGKGFTYMGNQYRIQVGNKDFYTDLLFYHRELQCLVLFELKIQEFEPEFLGKLNFYLEALNRNVKRQHEKPSIGILLCKGKDTEVVEYAHAGNKSSALIADYQTNLIPKNVLIDKLNQLAALVSHKNKLT